MSEHTDLISSYQLLITVACTNTGGKMKGSHPRAADRCPFVPRHSLVRLPLSCSWECYVRGVAFFSMWHSIPRSGVSYLGMAMDKCRSASLGTHQNTIPLCIYVKGVFFCAYPCIFVCVCLCSCVGVCLCVCESDLDQVGRILLF